MRATPLTLLLVEDNEDDVFLMRRALKAAKINPLMHVALDGQQALDYLQGSGIFADRTLYPIPTIVFLDLKLPYVHGFEVLKWIREQESFKALPVAILTSSFEDRDLQKAKEFGVETYLVKPPSGEMILDALKAIEPIKS